jgi:hypothetical protein
MSSRRLLTIVWDVWDGGPVQCNCRWGVSNNEVIALFVGWCLRRVGALAPPESSVLVARTCHVISPIARRNRALPGMLQGTTEWDVPAPQCVLSGIVGNSVGAADLSPRRVCNAQLDTLSLCLSHCRARRGHQTLAHPESPARSPSIRNQALRLRWRGSCKSSQCDAHGARGFPRASAGSVFSNRARLTAKKQIRIGEVAVCMSSQQAGAVLQVAKSTGAVRPAQWETRTPVRRCSDMAMAIANN